MKGAKIGRKDTMIPEEENESEHEAQPQMISTRKQVGRGRKSNLDLLKANTEQYVLSLDYETFAKCPIPK